MQESVIFLCVYKVVVTKVHVQLSHLLMSFLFCLALVNVQVTAIYCSCYTPAIYYSQFASSARSAMTVGVADRISKDPDTAARAARPHAVT